MTGIQRPEDLVSVGKLLRYPSDVHQRTGEGLTNGRFVRHPSVCASGKSGHS